MNACPLQNQLVTCPNTGEQVQNLNDCPSQTGGTGSHCGGGSHSGKHSEHTITPIQILNTRENVTVNLGLG